MEKPIEIIRKFNKTDILMLEQSETMHGNFLNDKVKLADKFTVLADPFAAGWQTEMNAADALPDDDMVVNDIGLLTGFVEAEMVTARNHYQTMIVYLKQAFPDDNGVVKLFGQAMYEEARNNQLKMMELMELASAKANTSPYKGELLGKGFKQADITMLKTIELALRSKNKTQEAAISARPLASQNRIKALNLVWDRMVLVNDSAQVVFKDDFAKLQQYLLYPEATGETTPPAATTPTTTTTTDVKG